MSDVDTIGYFCCVFVSKSEKFQKPELGKLVKKRHDSRDLGIQVVAIPPATGSRVWVDFGILRAILVSETPTSRTQVPIL